MTLPLLKMSARSNGPHINAALHLFGTMERDLRAIAAEVLRDRTPDNIELALVSPIGLYCELRGLTLPRSAREVESHYVATTWGIDALVIAAARVCPKLSAWSDVMRAAVLAAPVDVLHVGIILSPDAAELVATQILWPATAETGVSCG